MNFHPGSPRCVTAEQAALIVRALPPAVAAVGVFVDRSPDEVVAIAARAGLRIVQLHGDEPTEHLLALSHFELIRAFRLRAAADWVAVSEYLDRARSVGRVPESVLIDAYVAGQPGGTGATIVSDVLDAIPRLSLPRLILAGGLTPENVAAQYTTSPALDGRCRQRRGVSSQDARTRKRSSGSLRPHDVPVSSLPKIPCRFTPRECPFRRGIDDLDRMLSFLLSERGSC